jgi:hypothetical protein
MEDVLLSVEPNRRYVSRVSGDALTAEVTTSLDPSGEGTQVSVRWTGSGQHPIVRLMLPFMRKSIRRQGADLCKLRGLSRGPFHRPPAHRRISQAASDRGPRPYQSSARNRSHSSAS